MRRRSGGGGREEGRRRERLKSEIDWRKLEQCLRKVIGDEGRLTGDNCYLIQHSPRITQARRFLQCWIFVLLNGSFDFPLTLFGCSAHSEEVIGRGTTVLGTSTTVVRVQ